MTHRLALVLLAFAAAARAEPYTGPIFDAHLHYNVEAAGHYPVGTVFELFRKNGVGAILANSRPNDGSRALHDAWKRNPAIGVQVVPFIRVYRTRADYGFSPLMFASALVQYNSSLSSLDTSLRFRWEYRPGSDFFVVYTDNRDTTLTGFPTLRNRALVVKLTRLFRM